MSTPIDSIVTQPRKIFGRSHKIRRREAALLGSLEQYRGRKLSPNAVRTLASFPRVLGFAILQDCVPFDAQTEALADPYVAFQVMMEHYGRLSPILEDDYVLPSPVSLALLIDHLTKYPMESRRSMKFYLDLLARQDPNRRIWLAPRSEWPELVTYYRARTDFTNPTTAAWAHFRVLVTDPSTQLSSELTRALETDDEYLYRTAALFKERGAAGKSVPRLDPLLRSIKTPRWAYHALRDRLTKSPEVLNHLFHVVQRDLAWLVEAINEPIWDKNGQMGGSIRMDKASFMLLYMNVIRQNYISPLVVDMHEYAAEVGIPERGSELAAQADQIELRHASLDQLVAPFVSDAR